jgi:periplasmic divalent cation tolerance protein
MANLILIYVTCVSKKEAKLIARNLIEDKLIACANIVDNIESIYSYNGEVYNDNETLLLLKTKHNLFEKVKSTILRLHSYDTPCIIMLDIKNANFDFADWIALSVQK